MSLTKISLPSALRTFLFLGVVISSLFLGGVKAEAATTNWNYTQTWDSVTCTGQGQDTVCLPNGGTESAIVASFSATDGGTSVNTYAPGATVSVSVLAGTGAGNSFNGRDPIGLNNAALNFFFGTKEYAVGASAYYGGDGASCALTTRCNGSGTFTAPATPGTYHINLSGWWYKSDTYIATSDMIFYVACASGTNWSGSSCVSCASPNTWNSTTKTCDVPVTPVTIANCAGTWSGYGTCSKTCGTGTQSNTYTVTTAQSGTGTACPTSPVSQDCNTQACPPNTPNTNCTGTWSGYGTCSATCDGGTQSKTFTVDSAQSGTGTACPTSPVSQDCNTQACPPNTPNTNCVGSWSDNGTCSVSACGQTGVVQQTYTITTPQSGTGTSCPYANDATQWGSTSCPGACSPGNPPIGTIDSVTSGAVGSCGYVGGWAFDPDVPSQSIHVHIYVDGQAGSGAWGKDTGATSVSRSDVNTVYGITGTHGYGYQIPSNIATAGTHTVYAYGIGIDGIGVQDGQNPLLKNSPATFTCCDNNHTWNSTSNTCVANTTNSDGQCSTTTRNGCIPSTTASTNNVNGTSAYTWTCPGTGTGTAASCSESKSACTVDYPYSETRPDAIASYCSATGVTCPAGQQYVSSIDCHSGTNTSGQVDWSRYGNGGSCTTDPHCTGCGCVAITGGTCTSLPANATAWPTTAPSSDTPYSFSASTPTGTCKYYCNNGYTWNGANSCTATTLPTVTSSFTPSVILSTGSTVYQYTSQNTAHCVTTHPGGTGTWDNIATNASFSGTYTASQLPNGGLTTTQTCYDTLGTSGNSAVSTASVKVCQVGQTTDGVVCITPQTTGSDLTAGSVSPTSSAVDVSTTYSATITNIGNAPTGSGFTNLFQKATDASGTGATDIGTSASVALIAGGTASASLSYSFPSVGTFYLRVCADKSSAGSVGTITESNENNNCGEWTAITIASSPGGCVPGDPGCPSECTGTAHTSSCSSTELNSCGQYGTGLESFDCNGNVTVLCNAGAYSDPAVFASISATPNRVKIGGSTKVTWVTSGANSCTITKNDGTTLKKLTDSSCHITPTYTMDTVTTQTTYSINCSNATYQATASSNIVNVVPLYQEF